jgi:L-amino acid N-acyltransferase YncA
MKEISYTFEKMGEEHRIGVVDVYNHFIRHSMAAFPEEPIPYAMFDKFMEMAKGYPAYVVMEAEGPVVGFAFLRPFLAISTFSRTAEIAYFIFPEHTNKGIGSVLLRLLFEGAEKMGLRTILAGISSENSQSLAFHVKNGFTECGRFRNVGIKNGRNFDMVWMQRDVG